MTTSSINRAAFALTALVLLAVGVVLCRAEFGIMFWGNWLHTTTFTVGLLFIIAGIAMLAGTLTRNVVLGVSTFVTFAAFDLFLFWTMPGWILLHSLISERIGHGVM